MGLHGGIAAVVVLMVDGFIRWLAWLVSPSETVKRLRREGKLKPQDCDPCAWPECGCHERREGCRAIQAGRKDAI